MADVNLYRLGAESKICSKCGEIKPRAEYNKERGRERAYCKACHKAATGEWVDKNREKRRTYSREWAAQNTLKLKQAGIKRKPVRRSDAAKANQANYARRRHLERKYGLTPESWQEMHDAQGGVCALCQIPGRTGKHGKLAVDHCHSTGRVRGLLCASCNVSIGILGDSPERLERVLQYLKGEVIRV